LILYAFFPCQSAKRFGISRLKLVGILVEEIKKTDQRLALTGLRSRE
jgi:hypothetical protein